jgi:hypothetical protein
MVQKIRNIFEIVSPNLNPDGGVGRTQKQKGLKQFVVVSSRLKPFVFQIHFKHLGVAYIFEYRNIDPWLCFPRRDHNSIIPAPTELLYTRCLVFYSRLAYAFNWFNSPDCSRPSFIPGNKNAISGVSFSEVHHQRQEDGASEINLASVFIMFFFYPVTGESDAFVDQV